MWVGAVGSDAGEREGQRGKERPQEKKKKRKDDQVAPIIKVSRRARPDAFIGWFVFFPWAGGPPASDPDA